MSHHYLFFCSHSYAVPILRPLQREILRRGDQVAWFLETTCPKQMLKETDLPLRTLKEVEEWNPRAVFVPGNRVCDFFPGVKVEIFHGYPINKRNRVHDTHFRLRGWFDLYCTQGPSSTLPFLQLAKEKKYFKVYETGWAKTDDLISVKEQQKKMPKGANHTPEIFVATTFSKGISSLDILYDTIAELVERRDWRWKITMHPVLKDKKLRAKYAQLAQTHDNVEFYPITPPVEVMAQTDVMLCDASSIILEYMLLDKPVVTYHNTAPGPHLIDVKEVGEVEQAIEKALTRPQALFDAMHQYLEKHEAHRDGHNCARILDAVEDFITTQQNTLKPKPQNLFRRMMIRYQYWKQTYLPQRV